MAADFGTDGDGWEGVDGPDEDLVVGEGTKGCDEEGGDLV